MKNEVVFVILILLLLLVALVQGIMLANRDEAIDKLNYTISNLLDDNIKMYNYINEKINKKNIEPFEEFNARSKK